MVARSRAQSGAVDPIHRRIAERRPGQGAALIPFAITITRSKPMPIPHNESDRKVRPLTPQQRARICEEIHRQIAWEYCNGKNSRREVWARLCIGLRPFPRRVFSDGTSIRSEP
jgi:hypothetical protein